MKGKEALSLPNAQAEQSVRSDVPVAGGEAGGQRLQGGGREGAAEGGPAAHGAPAAPGEEDEQGHQAAEGWSQKSHPKDGPRKREAEERYF